MISHNEGSSIEFTMGYSNVLNGMSLRMLMELFLPCCNAIFGCLYRNSSMVTRSHLITIVRILRGYLLQSFVILLGYLPQSFVFYLV